MPFGVQKNRSNPWWEEIIYRQTVRNVKHFLQPTGRAQILSCANSSTGMGEDQLHVGGGGKMLAKMGTICSYIYYKKIMCSFFSPPFHPPPP